MNLCENLHTAFDSLMQHQLCTGDELFRSCVPFLCSRAVALGSTAAAAMLAGSAQWVVITMRNTFVRDAEVMEVR
jgi:hypothetical protein